MIRLFKLVEDVEIHVYDHTFDFYKQLEDFTKSPDFKSKQEKTRKFLEKLGVVFP